MTTRSLFLIVALCSTATITHAMENKVTLPSAKKLRESIWQGGFASFDSVTNIACYLDKATLSLGQLSNIVGIYVCRYIQNSYDEAEAQRKHMGFDVSRPAAIKKEEVLKCILRDKPKVYHQLLELEKLPELDHRQSKL